jgi:hypothetical protein
LISGKQVIRLDLSGLIDVYGAALIAKDQWKPGEKSKISNLNEIDNFSMKIMTER